MTPIFGICLLNYETIQLHSLSIVWKFPARRSSKNTLQFPSIIHNFNGKLFFSHFQSTFTPSVELLSRLPWLVVIVSISLDIADVRIFSRCLPKLLNYCFLRELPCFTRYCGRSGGEVWVGGSLTRWTTQHRSIHISHSILYRYPSTCFSIKISISLHWSSLRRRF